MHDGLHLLDTKGADLVFLENVGNLVCPAIYDLGQAACVVALSVTEGEDKPLKYPVMFRRADLVVLTKIDLLPLLYLVQALVCGFGSVIVVLMTSCLVWRRPLDVKVLGELADLMSWTTVAWLALRLGDVVVRGRLGDAFALDAFSVLFLVETAVIAAPALLMRSPRLRAGPRALYASALLACLGGLAYRFIPTTLAYAPGKGSTYFPSVPELVITLGLVATVVGAFSLVVKRFAVLPAPLESWHHAVEHTPLAHPSTRSDAHGHPAHD